VIRSFTSHQQRSRFLQWWKYPAVMVEQDEHWQLEGRRMFSQESMAANPPVAEDLSEAEPQAQATA
jgi:hypothetical protein